MFVVLVAVKELPLLDGAGGCGGGVGAAASKSNRTTGGGTHLKIPRVSVATLYAFLWGHLRGERTKCALAPTYRLKNFCQLENSSVQFVEIHTPHFDWRWKNGSRQSRSQTLLIRPAMEHKNLLKLSHAMLTSAANKHYSKNPKKYRLCECFWV